ncbi:hypothetical protein H5410_001319, partial [Solanum commersonii]
MKTALRQPPCELITSLPRQPPNIFFKQHSGYIVTNSQHGRALFYYFVHKMQHHFPLLLDQW